MVIDVNLALSNVHAPQLSLLLLVPSIDLSLELPYLSFDHISPHPERLLSVFHHFVPQFLLLRSRACGSAARSSLSSWPSRTSSSRSAFSCARRS